MRFIEYFINTSSRKLRECGVASKAALTPLAWPLTSAQQQRSSAKRLAFKNAVEEREEINRIREVSKETYSC